MMHLRIFGRISVKLCLHSAACFVVLQHQVMCFVWVRLNCKQAIIMIKYKASQVSTMLRKAERSRPSQGSLTEQQGSVTEQNLPTLLCHFTE